VIRLAKTVVVIVFMAAVAVMLPIAINIAENSTPTTEAMQTLNSETHTATLDSGSIYTIITTENSSNGSYSDQIYAISSPIQLGNATRIETETQSEIDSRSVLSTATKIVAANDSLTASRAEADYVCDGIDDQVEIQEAIDALQNTGGTIVLLGGNYNLSDSISCELTNWSHPVQIAGYGAVLTYTGSSGYAINLRLNHSGGIFHQDSIFILEGLTLIGNADCSGGILLDRAQNIVIERLHIKHFTNPTSGQAIRIIDSGDDCSEYNTIRSCNLYNNHIGISVDVVNSAANTRIENTIITLVANPNARGIETSGTFDRSLLSNVVVHMGSATGHRAFSFNGSTKGVVIVSCAMDDHLSTASDQTVLWVGPSASGNLVVVNMSYASRNTNLLPYYVGCNDYSVRFFQGELSDNINIFPDGTFESGVNWLTAFNCTLEGDTSTTKIGEQSLKITCNDAGGSGAGAYYDFPDYARYSGKWVTISLYYKAPTTNSQPQAISIWDGVGSAVYTPTLTKDGSWHYVELRMLVNSGANKLRVNFIVNNAAETDIDDILYISGVYVNEGLEANL
jgi:hypothetical protein